MAINIQEDELFALLTEAIYAHDGDFDEWLREADDETVGLARELVVGAYFGARSVTRSQIEHRLEATWARVKDDISVALEDDR